MILLPLNHRWGFGDDVVNHAGDAENFHTHIIRHTGLLFVNSMPHELFAQGDGQETDGDSRQKQGCDQNRVDGTH